MELRGFWRGTDGCVELRGTQICIFSDAELYYNLENVPQNLSMTGQSFNDTGVTVIENKKSEFKNPFDDHSQKALSYAVLILTDGEKALSRKAYYFFPQPTEHLLFYLNSDNYVKHKPF